MTDEKGQDLEIADEKQLDISDKISLSFESRKVLSIINSMGEKCREILWLRSLRKTYEEIAEEIKQTGKLLRPIELKRNDSKDPEKPYVLVRGRMRFWGWLIAYGYDKKIDSKIFE